MTQESVKEFYNRQYTHHCAKQFGCPNAIHDMDKAIRRVFGVIRGFGIRDLAHAKILDVGCGLGYYTKALSLTGANVWGVDFSEVAITAAQVRFPDCVFSQGVWPDDVAAEPEFDLIWMVNFSMMNTFDVEFIEQALIREAMRRLRPGGTLVVGWNSDFSGRVVNGYSHWSLSMLTSMRDRSGLSAPFVTEARTQALSWLTIRFAAAVARSVPIFMTKRNHHL